MYFKQVGVAHPPNIDTGKMIGRYVNRLDCFRVGVMVGDSEGRPGKRCMLDRGSRSRLNSIHFIRALHS